MFSSTKIMQALSPAGAAAGYQISRSLRFNSADSTYLTRTYGSAGNRKTWTLSLWLKRSTLGAVNNFSGSMNAGGTTGTEFFFSSGDLLTFDEYVSSSLQFNLTTTQVFRDVSAWYNIVFAVDTTQATASNRIKIYVNGTQVTAFGTATYPTQNLDTQFNFTSAMAFGRNGSFTSGYFNGYMADIYFIDGQALTPSSFGETDSATGVWVPKAYTGTYGTNGFWLKFDDNSGTTSTTLGKDSSGNSNNWTPNNFSVTAGAGNDSLVDSPTNYGTDTGAGGEVRGNYATLNPLAGSTIQVLSNGNLNYKANSTSFGRKISSIGMRTGKWYAEFTFTNAGANTNQAGVVSFVPPVDSTNQNGEETGECHFNNDNGTNDGTIFVDGTRVLTGLSVSVSGDVIGVALDADANNVKFFRNGAALGSTSGYTPTNVSGIWYFTVSINTSPTEIDCNFGQRPFAYTAPSGFKALCTQNLPTPAIGASSTTLANKQFDATLYTGTGSALTVTNAGSFQPDLVWYKDRSAASSNALFDAIRGVDKWITSNGTDAEATISGVSAFNSNGFSLGTNAGGNFSGRSYVAWQWNAGGSSVSNTSGTITSTVRANQTAGISVVTYTGNGTTGTVGHGLGVKPALIIEKNRTTGGGNNWGVYHKSLTASQYIYLNLTDAANSTGAATAWGNNSSTVEPTSSVFTVGSSSGWNGSAQNYVAYCFAEVAGFSRFGSYTGNGSTDGPFIFTGFRPRWVLIKQSSGVGGNWILMDSARSPYNVIGDFLLPNVSNAEGSSSASNIDFTSNGFKVRNSNADRNASGETYIFMAFAESPFNYSRAR